MAEVTVPEETTEETTEEETIVVDKPTEKSKVISVNFNPLDTKVTKNVNTKEVFFTTDTDAWIALIISGMNEPTGQYSLALYNKHDGSLFQRTGDIVNGVAYYKLIQDEIKHAGDWIGQAVITLDNGQTTASRFSFAVAGHIIDGKDVRQIVIQDFQTLMSQLNNLKDVADIDLSALLSSVESAQELAIANEAERQETFDTNESARQTEHSASKTAFDDNLTELSTLIETDVVGLAVDEKYGEMEATYATNLTKLKTSDESLAAQLAQTQQDFDTAVSEITVDSEVVLARGGETVLNNRLNKIASTLAVHDKDVVVSATNLISNSDFSNGATGWNPLFSKNTVLNNTLIITGDGTNANPRTFQNTGFNLLAGNKIYSKIKLRVKNDIATQLIGELKTTNAVTTIVSVFSKTIPIIDTWYTNTNVITAPNSSSNISFQIYHSYGSNNLALDKIAEIQYVILIDLTATFGAGNEPTVTQMDRLLTQFPNSWFDGTENLFLAKWALQELRRLDNEKANKKQEDWITPTLLNGWTVRTSVEYIKDSLGFIHVRGSIQKGTEGTIALVFPVGYRPAKQTELIGKASGTSTGGMTVLPDGTITIYGYVSWLSLNDICFLAEQ